MARRLIIDDSTGAIYEDFTARRVVSLADVLTAEGGATETVEIFLVTVNPQTRAVATASIATANVSLDIGPLMASPSGGKVIIGYGGESTDELPVATLNADSFGMAFNRLDAVESDGGADVWAAGDPGGLSFYIRLQDTGAPGTNPSVDCDGSTPPSAAEVTVVTAGSTTERAVWLVQIAESPVASIAESAWSTVTSGSFGGLTASLALNGVGLLAHLAKKDQPALTLTVKNSGSVILRGEIPAFPAVDPTDLNGSAILSIFPRIVTSTSNPGVTDDSADGYAVGTVWLNTSTTAAWILMDSTEGAAGWTELTEVTGGYATTGDLASYLPKAGGAMTGAITTSSTFDGVDIATRDAVLTATTTTANAALPKSGGAMTGAITTNSTFDGVDVATRDGVLSSTTTTANAALPKSGGTMTGDLFTGSDGSGVDVQFYSATAGDNLLWDASEERLVITGTDSQMALHVADGNLVAADKVGIGDTDPGTQLQLSGTTPYVTLKNSTSENTDGGCESKIIFEDHSDYPLAQIQGSHDGSSDDIKGDLIFSTNDGSTLDEALRIDSSQLATFAGSVKFKVYTVSALPSASPSGQKVFVSDSYYAHSYSYLASVVSGSGSNFVPVYSDGTYWKIG